MIKGVIMETMRFDTHTYVKKLKSAGFTEAQAEVQAETLSGLISDDLANKHDLDLLKQDLLALEERLTYRLTVRLGSMLVVGIGMVTALVRIG